MTGTDWMLLAIVIGLIVCSALFSGSETALTAASRARMHSLERSGEARAGIVMSLLERKDRLIGTLLIANNLVNILSSALATSVLIRAFGDSGVAIATALMTVLLVIFGEVMPKSLALARAEDVSVAVARPISALVWLLSPLTAVLTPLVRAILALIGVRLDSSQSILSAHEEIRGQVEVLAREGQVVKDDRYRLGGILDLHELTVADIMVHRTKMTSIDIAEPPEAVIRQIVSSPHTRIPVWRDSPENIVGLVHARDALRALVSLDDRGKFDLSRVMTKPWYVPDTTRLQDQLNAFLRRNAHMALVVDEYGEVRGLVTLEDIMEEIVGDIADEHDVEVQGVQPQADGSVIVDGAVPIRDLNRALDWRLPDEEATTVAGLVIHEAQMIPDEKQTFTFHGKRFTVMKRERNKLTRLRIRELADS